MRYFNNLAFMSEKKMFKIQQYFLARFVSGPYNRLKNLSAAVNASRSTTRILLRERGLVPKVNFFAQKLSNLGPVLKKLMQPKRITEGTWEGIGVARGAQGARPPQLKYHQ